MSFENTVNLDWPVLYSRFGYRLFFLIARTGSDKTGWKGNYFNQWRPDKLILLSLRTILAFKGGYLDFSHLTKLKKIMFVSEIYMKKQYQSSITKNYKITKKKMFLMVFP